MTGRLVVASLVLALAGASAAAAAAASPQPNFLYVLADDLDFDYKQDRKAIMPNLKREMAEGGLEFRNHVAVVPVCGPSRSSLLAGRFPHNVGYVANAVQASVKAFRALQNNTIGAWMRKQGYYTAFLGKYINGMECEVPMGWNHWGGLTCTKLNAGQSPYTRFTGQLGGTYNYYNASQWNLDFDDDDRQVRGGAGAGAGAGEDALLIHTGVHQTEFLANQTLEQVRIARSRGRPFFVHVTPLTVHSGTCYGPQPADQYEPTDPFNERFDHNPTLNSSGLPKMNAVMGSPCPTVRNRWAFKGLANPHTPAWGKFANGTVPDLIRRQGDVDAGRGCCDEWEARKQDRAYRNRTSAALDLDDMLGRVLAGLKAMGAYENTYVFFTSDNGYHLGEHQLMLGKTEPYETDTRLPMYVRGPGVPAGEVRPHPTNHLDITKTIADLAGGAGVHAPHPLDGQSFTALLHSSGAAVPAVGAWRPFSFSEFYVGANTWHKIRYVNGTTGEAEWSLHWWCSNQSEVFDLRRDPYETVNLGGAQPTAYAQRLLDRHLGGTRLLGQCVGEQCHVMPPQTAAVPNLLPCHPRDEPIDVEEAWLDYDGY